MHKTHFFYVLLVMVAICFPPAAFAEQTVLPTTYTATAPFQKPVSSTKTVVFSQQTTYVGDRVTQRVGMELGLHTVIKQAGQIANDSKTAMRSRQEREIEVLEVTNGQARRARVSYPLAREMSPENPKPEIEVSQEVEGKSYLITRSGTQLLITDSSGAIPTRKEFEIVLSSMENFGKANPLAEFLLSQEIQIGDTLKVPTEIAANMMGFDKMGEVEKFELRLEELREVDGRQCALFYATIATVGSTQAPLRIVATGSVAIEIATGRTIEATLKGPVTMKSIENGVFYNTSGDLLMAVQSYYRTK